jgi:hypothetical protein
MKNLLFLIITLLSLSANSIESVMNCTVKKQAVYNFNDGKVAEYSGYKDSIKIGDAYKLRYGIDGNDKLYFVMDEGSLLHPTVYYYANLDNSKIDGMYGYANIQPNNLLAGHKSSFNEDSFSLSMGTNWLHNFNRHNKDDWMGISTYQIVRNSSINKHTIFWGCEHITSSKFNKIFNRLNSLK